MERYLRGFGQKNPAAVGLDAVLTVAAFRISVKCRVTGKLVSMSESEAGNIVTAYLDALEQRDFEQLRSYLSDTEFFYRSPVSMTDNADDYITIISRVGPILEGIERIRTLIDGGEVCSVLQFRTTMETLKQVPMVHLSTVRSGKIVAIETFFDASEYNKMFDVES